MNKIKAHLNIRGMLVSMKWKEGNNWNKFFQITHYLNVSLKGLLAARLVHACFISFSNKISGQNSKLV